MKCNNLFSVFLQQWWSPVCCRPWKHHSNLLHNHFREPPQPQSSQWQSAFCCVERWWFQDRVLWYGRSCVWVGHLHRETCWWECAQVLQLHQCSYQPWWQENLRCWFRQDSKRSGWFSGMLYYTWGIENWINCDDINSLAQGCSNSSVYRKVTTVLH